MRRRRYLLVLPVVLSTALASCSSPPEPALQAAQAQADAFVESEAASANFLGAGSFLALQHDAVPLPDEGITLDYESDARIEGVNVACFGGGEASFGASVRTGSSWTGLDVMTLACDGEPRTAPLNEPLERVNALRLNGQIQDGAGAVIAAAIMGTAG